MNRQINRIMEQRWVVFVTCMFLIFKPSSILFMNAKQRYNLIDKICKKDHINTSNDNKSIKKEIEQF